MNYNFPVLTLESVREAIAGRADFIEANRGDHIIFNYNVAFPDSFDCPIRRECRGLIFSPEGEILSRRFHKFFNMNEREETLVHHVCEKMQNEKYNILHKLDGSMITPIVLNGVVRWGTKMGLTDVANHVEDFIASYNCKNYVDFAWYCHEKKITPIFEYVGPYNRIILPYTTQNLTLLAIRENHSGDYLSYDRIRELAYHYDVQVVEQLDINIEQVSDMVDMEGIVLVFEDGHRVKVKSDWYVNLHKAKENLLHEKNVISMFINNELDDVLPHLMNEDKKKIKSYLDDFIFCFRNTRYELYCTLSTMRSIKMERKQFALGPAKKYNGLARALMFKLWDFTGDEQELLTAVSDQMMQIVKSKLSSQASVEELRDWLKFRKWDY